MKLFTPARTTAAIGVLTGLAGVATALLGVVDVHGPVGTGLVALGGYLTTGISVAKFLEGQAGWEQQQSAQVHTASLVALDAMRSAPVVDVTPNEPEYAYDDHETAPLEVVDPNEPERPARMQDQLPS